LSLQWIEDTAAEERVDKLTGSLAKLEATKLINKQINLNLALRERISSPF